MPGLTYFHFPIKYLDISELTLVINSVKMSIFTLLSVSALN